MTSKNMVPNPVPRLYESVVEEVISKVRDSVLDEGLDESVLCDLKALWTKKLEESKAMSGPEPTNEYRSYVGRHGPPGDTPNIYHPHPQQAPLHRQPPYRHIQQQQIPHPRLGPRVMPLPGIPTPLPQPIPQPVMRPHPTQAYNPRMPARASHHPHPIPASSPMALHPQHGPIPPHSQSPHSYPNEHPNPSQTPTPPLHPHHPASRNAPRHISPHIIRQNHTIQRHGLPISSPAPQMQHQSVIQANHYRPGQVDGAIDTDSSDLDSSSDEEPPPAPYTQEDAEPLNSDDDVSDSNDNEIFETENIVICQFDKIARVRNKWRFQLVNGIMTLNGKDYVFQKATGDGEW
ncbi:Oidioi.mRNA.OKI2018_I69.chr2.g7725.t1.cds [Oikopleura dioica]|uniref:Oidioi.mRNA.OKI2018_I69.chr2.g7725.t1.cds n=1 Tax=Oikopleura dioica TaxID=34765 RepID=A0ABN7TBU9_OIKDI|nr:Oidioi.mRNA.OKI2018_I69.chr2.g7725.t1.cds [Oikopleura dioica]